MVHTDIARKVTVFILLVCSASVALASPSNKWRLEFSGGAHSAGEIVIELTPKGLDPLTVRISVADNTSENHVAKRVTEVLREELPSEAFHVERDDGEDVLIKKRHGAANFDLQIFARENFSPCTIARGLNFYD